MPLLVTFSECWKQKDKAFPGGDINIEIEGEVVPWSLLVRNNKYKGHPSRDQKNAKACQALCEKNSAKYFTYRGDKPDGKRQCWCKKTLGDGTGPEAKVGAVTGRVECCPLLDKWGGAQFQCWDGECATVSEYMCSGAHRCNWDRPDENGYIGPIYPVNHVEICSSDGKSCEYVVRDYQDAFLCQDGYCVSNFTKCDGWAGRETDCPDGSDETEHGCGTDCDLRCNGRCIKEALKCDGWSHCDGM